MNPFYVGKPKKYIFLSKFLYEIGEILPHIRNIIGDTLLFYLPLYNL